MNEQNLILATEQDEKLHKAEKGVRQYQLLLIRLLILLTVLWALFFFVIGICKMPNEDMEPRIYANNTMIFFRLDKSPVKDDIMVYDKAVKGKRETHIGRVIAVAGDTVEITKSNRVVVNGNTLLENKIFNETPAMEQVTYPITLKEGEYFVLADRRDDAVDSRYFGPITKKDTVGTVLLAINRTNL